MVKARPALPSSKKEEVMNETPFVLICEKIELITPVSAKEFEEAVGKATDILETHPHLKSYSPVLYVSCYEW